MSKILAGIAALTLMGAAALPVQASAADQKAGVASQSTEQSTELSSQRHWRHGRHYARPYWGPRRHWGPRYGYYGPRYGYYGSPYPYYGYRYPGAYFGVGPFGFRVF